MDSGPAPCGASRNDHHLLPLRHLPGALAEHVLARLLVEWLLDELADGKPCLHLWARANVGVPALDVRIVVEGEALRLVGHGPGKARNIGNRIIMSGNIGAGL